MGRTVAIVANTTWNLWNFRRELVRSLHRAGHRILLLAPDGPEKEDLRQLPATLILLKHLRRSGMNPVRDLALLRELTAIYRREKVTHALHFTIKPVIYGSLAARRAGVINISTLTGLGYTFIAGGWTTVAVQRLYRYALRDAHRIFFHNPDDEALFLNRKLCRPEQTTVVGGSGLPLPDFPLVNYDKANPNRILFAGRLLADKGIHEYVTAARLARRQNPDLRFHVLGPLDDGNPAGLSRRQLNDLVAAGDIIYDGVTTDIRPHLAKATLVVLPSYREGCPRVLLEAAATGRALVGTDVPGVREIVRPENSLRVPVRDGAALAGGIVALLAEGKEALRERGLAGRRLVERRFSAAVVNDFYSGVVGE